MEAQQKQCPKCGIVKPFSEFCKRKGAKYGLDYHCKQCAKKYKAANPVLIQTGQMTIDARKRAKSKNIPFEIDCEYVRSLVVSHCPILPTISLEWSIRDQDKRGGRDNSPSLDRIDPTKGYVKGNVWIISQKANRIKNNATHEELKLVTEAVGRAIVNSLDW